MRLFVAVNPPDNLRDALSRAAAPLRNRGFPIRWADRAGVHITLKFLGEVAAEREPEVIAAVQAACDGTRTFALPVEDFGAFPSVARPRVVWAGCEPAPALELLQHALEHGLAQLGFPVEGRPFRPHLTLGRVKRGVRRIDGFAEAIDGVAFQDEFVVRSIDLMESTLTPAGARYSVRRAVELAS